MPVLDDGFVLPESEVIMEYLEERYPERPLLPAEPRSSAPQARLLVHRFDDNLGDDYYAFRRGDDERPGGQARRARGGAEPLRGHRLRAVGDPRARHARRRSCRSASPTGSPGSRERPVGRRRGRDRASACDRDRARRARGAARRGADPRRAVALRVRRHAAASRATRARATSPARATSTSTG